MNSQMLSLAKFAHFTVKGAHQWRRRSMRWPAVSELPRLCRKAWLQYQNQHGALRRGTDYLPAKEDSYEVWLALNTWNARSERDLHDRLSSAGAPLPTISVIIPVYDPPPGLLELAIRSVATQVYAKWQLCIADDAGANQEVRELLSIWAARDPRIRIEFRKENGKTSRATNSAASLATGDFLLFLDHDDELSPDALAEVALYIAAHPNTDFLYSDDDKIDAQGRRFAPQFKPDWSPELLLSYMFCSHLTAVRRSLFEELGGMRTGFEGSQDYDFALRVTEKARHVGHIPLVLYHWRAIPGSTAVSGDAKPDSIDAGRRALQEAFDRRGIAGIVSRPDWAVAAKAGIFQHEFPDEGPSVTIIIPTRNRHKLLRTCVNSLSRTTYRNYKVLIVDNGSDEPEAIEFLIACGHPVTTVRERNGHFNFSFINNRAVEQVDTDYVLFLNSDTEVREPRWLSRMIGYAQIPGVGAVGARLIFPDGQIQHAGIVHGLYHGMAGPAFKLAQSEDHGYLSYAKVVRNCSAVTAACMLTPRDLFLTMEGFDEAAFAVAYNDVDYCYRLSDRGYRCVYASGAELTHREGSSRGSGDNPSEEAAFRRKYAARTDPYYSPHLSLANERFEIMPRRIIRRQNRKAPNVFMVAFNLNLEGAAYSQFELTIGLKEKGIINPQVYSPQDGPLRSLYERAGIRLQIGPHPLLGVLTRAEYERAIRTFAGSIQASGAEVVYGNTLQTFYAIEAAKVSGIPSIWNPRESESWETYFYQFGLEIAPRALRCYSYPYRVIFVAKATREVHSHMNTHHNFAVIHNSLNLELLEKEAARWSGAKARTELRIGGDEIVLLLLGTVCERKGQQDVVKALAKLDTKLHCLIQCFIVGDRPGEYSRALHKLVSGLPGTLRNRVHVIPEEADTALYYRAADIFVCTSRIESYPRVILEAMAYGLPVVSTPAYGIREQIRPRVNGLFYEPGNCEQLASAIRELLVDPVLRKNLAKNSRAVLDTLTSFDEMISQYAEVFLEAAGSAPGNGSHESPANAECRGAKQRND